RAKGHAVPRGPEGLPVFSRLAPCRNRQLDECRSSGDQVVRLFSPARSDEERDKKLDGAVSFVGCAKSPREAIEASTMPGRFCARGWMCRTRRDRKSTRLNSSHRTI